MEPRPGFALQQLWANSESAITQKTSPSYEVKDSDIRRAVMAITAVPAATLPESAFLLTLGTPAFFFLEYGRCRTVARSLHEHKQ